MRKYIKNKKTAAEGNASIHNSENGRGEAGGRFLNFIYDRSCSLIVTIVAVVVVLLFF